MKRLCSLALLVTATAVGPAGAAAQRLGPTGGVTTLSDGVVLVVAPQPPANSPARLMEAKPPAALRLRPVSSAVLREALQAAGVTPTQSGEPFTLSLHTPLVAGRGVIAVKSARFNAGVNTILMDDNLSSVSVLTSDSTPTKRYMLQFTVADSSGSSAAFRILVAGGAEGAPFLEVPATRGKVQEILVLVTLPDNQLTSRGQWLATIERKYARWCFFGVQVTPM